ncbi:4'-phosphopantetheinyl transferase family protein [Streptomyces sp. NBC_01465]|uniref:4'-phosphopantetheinyl transferase family protein n=1 Tax=Streptomyces sp. NBC_01465 TaxID=2903878 RepID=UPI002E308569|nr:4'-phosphopantetheinyl transferase superfamily protein [Streptomyces sp. NBC_01465]
MIAKETLQPTELRPGWEQSVRPPDSPRIWLVRTRAFQPVVDRRAETVLDEAEKTRAARFRRTDDRDTYRAGHTALRLLLGAYLSTPPESLDLTRLPCPTCQEPHGRPVVRGNPLHFSLSHGDGLCLLAFARTPVGVDVEKIPTLDLADEVVETLHPQEIAELEAYAPETRPQAFARVWTRKEAYLKGLGTGLGRAPSLDYLGTAPDEPTAPEGWTINDIAVGETHAAALAVEAR